MSAKKPAKEPDTRSQVEKFQDLAREIGADDSEQPLNEAIRKVGQKRVKTKEGGK